MSTQLLYSFDLQKEHHNSNKCEIYVALSHATRRSNAVEPRGTVTHICDKYNKAFCCQQNILE